ncbi:MAG TPA: NADH-ubiquinone oxidoreductase-F iron-sulfur binding region domain-containing protein [Gaiellaceae bacterium]|nr:NADH-ubiquinone oxidoreductase-F iron-sulfur binding region domain-containing protein [Gaiellaceae bacterium]
MDLRLLETEPSEAERGAIDAVLGAEGVVSDRVARADRTKRHLLLPSLRAAQQRVGYVSEGALGYASRRLLVPPADAYGVASFYALLSLEERPADITHVCTDLSCALKGAHVGPGEHPSPCLGLCERAPASYRTIAGPEPREIQLPVEAPPLPQAGEPSLRLLRRIGAGVDPGSLDAYVAAGGFEALTRARELGAEAVIAEVKESRLLGRGGAAFPTGVKWDAVSKQTATPHYVVCNADESEPGTFKDRVLMEGDPFALVEAIALAGFATGALKGFIYVRAEYPLAHARITNAIEQSRPQLEGFEIELRIGAGAYVCGEETALFQSIEGYRGEPRNKPPFPVEVGLFGKPTAVNNVETLFNVLEVLREGGAAYARTGTEGSTGTRLFCVSGCVERPGLYELPFGATLRELLDLAGSAPPKAVLLGGAAGAFVGPDLFDVKLTHEDTRAAGITLGSGVVIVYDEQADLVAALLRIAAFFRDESCGQCVPCRVGTVRQEEALKRLAAGTPHTDELATLAELAQVMRDASICGLGQTAASAVESAIKNLGVFAA